jgi:DNA-binding MarR family transcriptional regulator
VIYHRAEELESLMTRTQIALFRGTHDPFANLPVGQLRLVRALESGPKTPTALAREMGLTTGAITQLATRLKAIGLVEEQIDQQDRRVKRLGLSESGQSCMGKRTHERTERVIAILQQLPESTQIALMEGLQDLYRIAVATEPSALEEAE